MIDGTISVLDGGLAILALALSALAAFSHLHARRLEARDPPVADLVDVGGGSIHVVDHPALVAGDRDAVVSPAIHAEALEREIAGARLTILRGIGHSSHHTAPQRVIEAIVAAADRAEAERLETA